MPYRNPYDKSFADIPESSNQFETNRESYLKKRCLYRCYRNMKSYGKLLADWVLEQKVLWNEIWVEEMKKCVQEDSSKCDPTGELNSYSDPCDYTPFSLTNNKNRCCEACAHTATVVANYSTACYASPYSYGYAIIAGGGLTCNPLGMCESECEDVNSDSYQDDEGDSFYAEGEDCTTCECCGNKYKALYETACGDLNDCAKAADDCFKDMATGSPSIQGCECQKKQKVGIGTMGHHEVKDKFVYKVVCGSTPSTHVAGGGCGDYTGVGSTRKGEPVTDTEEFDEFDKSGEENGEAACQAYLAKKISDLLKGVWIAGDESGHPEDDLGKYLQKLKCCCNAKQGFGCEPNGDPLPNDSCAKKASDAVQASNVAWTDCINMFAQNKQAPRGIAGTTQPCLPKYMPPQKTFGPKSDTPFCACPQCPESVGPCPKTNPNGNPVNPCMDKADWPEDYPS